MHCEIHNYTKSPYTIMSHHMKLLYSLSKNLTTVRGAVLSASCKINIIYKYIIIAILRFTSKWNRNNDVIYVIGN